VHLRRAKRRADVKRRKSFFLSRSVGGCSDTFGNARPSAKRGHCGPETRSLEDARVTCRRGAEIMSRAVDFVKTEIYFLFCTRLFAQNSCVKENYAISRHFKLAPG